MDQNGTRWLYQRVIVEDQRPMLIAGTKNAFNPFFSPDGNWIAFSNTPAGRAPEVWWQNLKTNKSSALVENEHATWSLAFSSVIDTLIFEQFNEQTRIAVEVADLWLLNLSQQKPDPWPGNSAENEHQADFSPDGKWIAYTSDLTGKKTASASLKTEDFAIHAGQEESAVGGGHSVKYGYCVDLQLRQFFSTLGRECLQLRPLQALVQLLLFRELCRRVGTVEFVEQTLFVDDVGCAGDK